MPTPLFEDNHLLVLSKPAGLLSQGAEAGEPHLVGVLQEYLGRPYVGLIHRLDRNVSGLMVIAKRTKAARRLSDDLRVGKIFRHYRGWVMGKLSDEQLLENYLFKNPSTNEVRVVSSNQSGAKIAKTRMIPIASKHFSSTTISLVEFQLETGRSHQIRVQCAHAGHPLIGDLKYGTSDSRQLFPNANRPLLHSYSLEFTHPMSKEKMRFEDQAGLAQLEKLLQ